MRRILCQLVPSRDEAETAKVLKVLVLYGKENKGLRESFARRGRKQLELTPVGAEALQEWPIFKMAPILSNLRDETAWDDGESYQRIEGSIQGEAEPEGWILWEPIHGDGKNRQTGRESDRNGLEMSLNPISALKGRASGRPPAGSEGGGLVCGVKSKKAFSSPMREISLAGVNTSLSLRVPQFGYRHRGWRSNRGGE